MYVQPIAPHEKEEPAVCGNAREARVLRVCGHRVCMCARALVLLTPKCARGAL